MLSHEVDQLGGGMHPLDPRQRPNKVLERCICPVNQGVCGGDVHDQYGNRVFDDGRDLHYIGGCVICWVQTGFPLSEINTLSVGDNIVTMRSKEISKCGFGRSTVLGAM